MQVMVQHHECIDAERSANRYAQCTDPLNQKTKHRAPPERR